MRELMTPINTPDEQFHGGNPSKGDACTVVTAKWLNDMQAAVRSNQNELLSILSAAVMDTDPGKKDQVLEALNKLFIRRSSGIGYYATVPGQQAEPIVYVPPYGLMHWLESAKVYRSVDCGAIILHPSATPRAGMIKANGAALSKTDYAGLWSWAQENGVAVANASWTAGTAFYGDVNASTFKVPDLRGEFLRAWDDGREIDSGRAHNSWQADSLQFHSHDIPTLAGITGTRAAPNNDVGMNTESNSALTTGRYYTYTDGPDGRWSQKETRPRNVVLSACIKF